MVRSAIVFLILCQSILSFGQRPPSFDESQIITDVKPIICPVSHEVNHHHVPYKKKKSPYKNNSTLNLSAQYGPGVPVEVTEAIEQRVFPIISEVFSSSIPVIIQFNWTQQTGGTLASAAPTGFVPNPSINTRVLNAFYPMPLAEKIARQEFNTPGEPDIRVTINSGINWCFDCETPEEVGSRFDFVSILLHEVYHGLGFVAFANVDDNGLGFQRQSGISGIMNIYFESLVGDSVILVQDGSERLGNLFQSNQLFFNIPTAGRAKIFAPNPFDPGSSISHVDEATFNNSPNSLMTPSSSAGEVERDAGIANDMMYDMGWLYTHLLHEPQDLTITQPTDQDYTVNLEIISDNGYVEEELRLHYSSDNFETEDIVVNFTNVSGDTYQAVIPHSNESKLIDYYIEVVDNRGLRFSHPGINITGLQFTNQYAFGPDVIDPVLFHNPVTSVKAVDVEVPLTANANDVFTGIDTLIIEWQFNGVMQNPVGMSLDTNNFFQDNLYLGSIPLPSNLSENDVLEYRLRAVDASVEENTTFSPETGFYRVNIVPIADAILVYNNDFNSTSDDFEGDGFQITQPSGFASQAIHSDHPYLNAGDLGELNFTYELKLPIILEEPGRANMVFDEIVLVEPGDLGSQFGDGNFWDYVIVEGKKLGDSRWLPFLDGYDASANPVWLNAFVNGIPTGEINSERAGTISMYRERTIDLLESGNFVSGDTVSIRFRLFSDPLVFGWGWAIEDLIIQDASVPVEDFILQENFELRPNPANDEVSLVLDLESRSESLLIQIVDISGKQVFKEIIADPSLSIRRDLDIQNLNDGLYFVNLIFDRKETITQKLIIQR